MTPAPAKIKGGPPIFINGNIFRVLIFFEESIGRLWRGARAAKTQILFKFAKNSENKGVGGPLKIMLFQ